MIACAERAATYFITLDMYQSAIVVLVLRRAPVTCSRAGMTASQSYFARSWTTLSVVKLLGALHVDRMTAARHRLADDRLTPDGLKILRSIAVDVVLEVAAWQCDAVQNNLTPSASFSTGRLLAGMAASWVLPLTWLFAFEDLVHSTGVASRLASVSAIWKTIHTGLATPTLRAEIREVVRLLNMNSSILVPRAP